jgi:hypothetical protein
MKLCFRSTGTSVSQQRRKLYDISTGYVTVAIVRLPYHAFFPTPLNLSKPSTTTDVIAPERWRSTRLASSSHPKRPELFCNPFRLRSTSSHRAIYHGSKHTQYGCPAPQATAKCPRRSRETRHHGHHLPCRFGCGHGEWVPGAVAARNDGVDQQAGELLLCGSRLRLIARADHGYLHRSEVSSTKAYIPRTLRLTSYAGHFQFLTIDGLWLTIVTCLLGGLGEMLPGVKGMSHTPHEITANPFAVLRTVRRAFLLIALPVELTISTIYVRPLPSGLDQALTHLSSGV